MRVYLYSVYDQVADEYGPIFESKSDAVALRGAEHLLSTVRPEFRSDYKLYRLGWFEDCRLVAETDGPIEVVRPELPGPDVEVVKVVPYAK